MGELISVNVASEFEQIGTETNMKYEEFASSVDKTITTAALIAELKSTKTSMNQITSI